MKIAYRASPHLETLAYSILQAGDTLTSPHDEGADYFLAWGWPQAQQVITDNGGRHSERMICVDCHPFALQAGDESGDRILQLGNWGALAQYPPQHQGPMVHPRDAFAPGGPTLVLGQVYTAEQRRLGLVDAWHTGGYDEWVLQALQEPGARFRKHPRIWARENDGERQPSLAADLAGCRRAVSWNSTAAVHARLLGYPATAAEAHGWAHLTLATLAAQRVTPAAIRSGHAWASYRAWLLWLRLQNAASSAPH